MTFYRDTPFPLKIHIIQYLVLIIPFRDGFSHFEKTIYVGGPNPPMCVSVQAVPPVGSSLRPGGVSVDLRPTQSGVFQDTVRVIVELRHE